MAVVDVSSKGNTLYNSRFEAKARGAGYMKAPDAKNGKAGVYLFKETGADAFKNGQGLIGDTDEGLSKADVNKILSNIVRHSDTVENPLGQFSFWNEVKENFSTYQNGNSEVTGDTLSRQLRKGHDNSKAPEKGYSASDVMDFGDYIQAKGRDEAFLPPRLDPRPLAPKFDPRKGQPFPGADSPGIGDRPSIFDPESPLNPPSFHPSAPKE
jgi:hypothetical protein